MTTQGIVAYLARLKLVRPGAIVDGDIEIRDASRRNLNLKVFSRSGASYFVKQGAEPGASRTLAREAALYRFFFSCTTGQRLRRYLPNYYCYNRRESLLICELRHGARSLWDHNLRSGRCSRQLAIQMGFALAALHRLTDSAKVRKTIRHEFGADCPGVLSFHEPTLAAVSRISAANLKLISIVQQYETFRSALERMRQTWVKNALIHFDIKADNWLVLNSNRPGRRGRVNLVDWELAGLGDACWDTGSVFADYLRHWLFSIPATSAPAVQLPEPDNFRLAAIQPAIRAFWDAYTRRMSLGDEADRWLLRSVEYAAARLLHRSYEQMQTQLTLPPSVVLALQVSQNMLKRPVEAAVRLLGLPVQKLST